MDTIIEKQNLRFRFDDSWWAIKYDGHPDHERIRALNKTKAVDFIAIHRPARVLYLIEVKDFRGHRIENRKGLSDGELAVKVAQKVRDTIPGIVAAQHRGSGHDWTRVIDRMTSREPPIRVLFWMEQDLPPGPRGRSQNRASTFDDALKRQLRWLTAQVLVGSSEIGRPPEGLIVENLPGAGRPDPHDIRPIRLST